MKQINKILTLLLYPVEILIKSLATFGYCLIFYFRADQGWHWGITYDSIRCGDNTIRGLMAPFGYTLKALGFLLIGFGLSQLLWR